jgi:hypothetical protein
VGQVLQSLPSLFAPAGKRDSDNEMMIMYAKKLKVKPFIGDGTDFLLSSRLMKFTNPHFS